jgi:hypothetical protein
MANWCATSCAMDSAQQLIIRSPQAALEMDRKSVCSSVHTRPMSPLKLVRVWIAPAQQLARAHRHSTGSDERPADLSLDAAEARLHINNNLGRTR